MPSPYIVKKLTELLGDSELVNIYLNKFGEIVNELYVEQIKKYAEVMMNPAAQKKQPNPKGEDPVYEMLFQCPACYREDVVVYQLRSKSQTIKESLFLVPQYSEFAKYFAVDFNLLQTTVCPDCLFASPDTKDWTQKSKLTSNIVESKLNAHRQLISDIRDQEFERKNKFAAAKADVNYFARPREYKVAIESIQLSIMRAELEAKYQIPAVSFKLGSYHLKIADIEKKMKKDNLPTLKKAEEYFYKTVINSECPTPALEMMSIYQIIALNLFFGDKEKAAEFLKITKNTLSQKEYEVKHEPSPEARAALTEISKWEKRIGILWEYRDEEEYWKQ